jgi:thymidylate synthase
MQQYINLIDRILTDGREQDDRTGKGTMYKFGEQITFDLQAGFPIVTLRHIPYKQAVGELAGFIHGATTVGEFEHFGCNYWKPWADKDGNLGPIYGHQWSSWPDDCGPIDQLEGLIHSLKFNPYSRRHILSTWNVADLGDMCLPPCHLIAQFDVTSSNDLNCIVYMRSCDIIIGLPYDIIVYGGLVHLLANQLNMYVGKLTFMLGNAHIYKPHIPGAIHLIKREPKPLPRVFIKNTDVLSFIPKELAVVNYQAHEAMTFEVFI